MVLQSRKALIVLGGPYLLRGRATVVCRCDRHLYKNGGSKGSLVGTTELFDIYTLATIAVPRNYPKLVNAFTFL